MKPHSNQVIPRGAEENHQGLELMNLPTPFWCWMQQSGTAGDWSVLPCVPQYSLERWNRLKLELPVIKDLNNRHVHEETPTESILKLLLEGSPSPAPPCTDGGPHLHADGPSDCLSSAEELCTPIHSTAAQTDRQTVSTGQRTQCFSEEAGWGTSIRKSVVEKKKKRKKNFRRKLLANEIVVW